MPLILLRAIADIDIIDDISLIDTFSAYYCHYFRHLIICLLFHIHYYYF